MSAPVDRLVQRQQSDLDGPERLVVGQVRQALAETFGSLEIDLRVVLAAIDEARDAGTPVDPAWLQSEPRYRRLQTRIREVRQAFVERVLAVMIQGRRLFAQRGRLDVLAQLTALGIGVPPSGRVRDTSTTSERSLRSLIDGLGQLNARVVEEQLGVLPDGAVPPPRPPRSPLLRMLDDPATDARTRTVIRTEVMRSYREAARDRHVAAGDVLQGVQWIASLSSRTCLACLHRHGQIFPVGYVMDAHPSCRCSLAPVAIGTPSAVPETGEEWFRKQPESVQRQRLGAAYEPFRDGRAGLGDFVSIREHPVWGRSIQQGSQRAVLASVGGTGPARRTRSLDAMSRDAPIPEPAIRTRSGGPIGSPVSAAIEYQGWLDQRLLGQTVGAIDEVHGDGTLPSLMSRIGSITPNRYAEAYGVFFRGTPPRITVNTNAPFPRITMAHEVGHFIDYLGVPGTQGNGYASVSNPIMAQWRSSVFASRAVQHIDDETFRIDQAARFRSLTSDERRTLAYLGYLVDEEELWARSYAQYIATHTTDGRIIAEWRALQTSNATSGIPRQWDDVDFAPIASAIDDLFRQLGWLQP